MWSLHTLHSQAKQRIFMLIYAYDDRCAAPLAENNHSWLVAEWLTNMTSNKLCVQCTDCVFPWWALYLCMCIRKESPQLKCSINAVLPMDPTGRLEKITKIGQMTKSIKTDLRDRRGNDMACARFRRIQMFSSEHALQSFYNTNCLW